MKKDDRIGSRTENSVRNMTYGVINKVVALFLSLGSRYIFLQILPIEYLGINGIFSDILAMLSLADLGFATAMAFSFYKPLAEHDENKLCELLTFYRRIYHIIALVVAVIGIALLPFLDFVVNVDYEIPHLRLYYLIALFNTVVSYLFAYKQSIITADQKYYVISRYSMWIAFAKIIFQTVVLYISHSYTLYLLVGVITTVAYNLLVNYQANKYYPFIRKKASLSREEQKGLLENADALFRYRIADVVISGTDNTLISILVNTAAVGIYNNYLTVINKIVQFASILTGSLGASVGNLTTSESKEKNYEVFRVMHLSCSWIATIVVICIYYLMEEFIGIWLGEQYISTRLVLIAILCNIYYNLVMQPIYIFREAIGIYKEVKNIMVICAVINIVLSLFLGRELGTAGIIFASVISKLLTTFWYEVKVLFKVYFEKSMSEYFVECAKQLLLCLIIGCLCGCIMNHFVVSSLLWWSVKGVFCVLMINIVLVMRYRKCSEFQFLIRKWIQLINKRIM